VRPCSSANTGSAFSTVVAIWCSEPFVMTLKNGAPSVASVEMP
jgi:hypothetical protein